MNRWGNPQPSYRPLPAYQRAPPDPGVNYGPNHPSQPQYPYPKSNWQENERPQDYQYQHQQDNRWEYGGPKNPYRNNNEFGGPQDPYHKNNQQEYVRADEPQAAYYSDGRRGYTRPAGDTGNGNSEKPWELVRPVVDAIPRSRKQVSRSASHVRRDDEPQITAQTRAWVVDQAGGRDQRTCVEMLKGEQQTFGRDNGIPGERPGNRPVEYARNGYKYEDRSGPNQNLNNTRMDDRMDNRNPVPYTSDPQPVPYMDRAKQGYIEGQDRFHQYPPEPRPSQDRNTGRPAQYGDPKPVHNGVRRPAPYREEPRPTQYGQPKHAQYMEGPPLPQYRDPRNGQYIEQPRPVQYPGEPRPAQMRGELTHSQFTGEPRAAPYPGEPKQAQYIKEPRSVQYREPRAAQYIQEPRPAPYHGDPRANWNTEQDQHVPYGRPAAY